MRQQIQGLFFLGLVSLVAAIFKDEVGEADFHHALIGLPQTETTFFHRPRREEKASLLYTLSDVGVIGAVKPSSGDVVWRQQIADGITNGGGHLRAAEDQDWLASAVGHRVSAWNALSGRNVWQAEFEGEVVDLEIMDVAEELRKDVLALFYESGETVLRRLHGSLGTVVWEFREISKDVPLQVSTNIEHVNLVSLHGSSSSYSLRITLLEISTGTRVDQATIGTKSDIHGPKDVMFVGRNSATPILAWADNSLTKLSVHVLGNKSNKQDFALAPGALSVQVHAPHLAQSQPHFLVHTTTETGNKAEVYHIDLKTSQINRAYELPLLPGKGAFSTSSSGANVYFTRITDDEVILVSSDSHGVLARWPLNVQGGLDPAHGVSEVVKRPSGEGYAIRVAALTEAEDWVLIRNGELDWTRGEGLTGAVAAVWSDAPSTEGLSQILEQEIHANPVTAYAHRVLRHVEDFLHLPSYLTALSSAIVNSVLQDGGASLKEGLKRDIFGFNKVIVLVTHRGRAYGVSSNDQGKILWNKALFPQKEGGTLHVKGLISTDAQGLVQLRGSRGELALIKAATGEIVEQRPGEQQLPAHSTVVVNTADGKQLVQLTTNGQLAGPTLTLEDLPIGTIVLHEDGLVKGVQFTAVAGEVTLQEVWQLQLPSGQRIVEIAAPPSSDPVASIGRVLADRKVNYKYLNANTFLVASVNEALLSLSLQLLDSVSGQLLASQTYEGIDVADDISCAMSENWYACSFFGQYSLEGTDRTIKGYQIAVSDLYESPSPNDRGPLGDAANFSSLEPVDTPTGPALPWVASQVFVVSEKVTKLTVTQTGQGVTTKQLLGYLPQSHGVAGLPRAMLDPRRPVGRDPTAIEVEAEGLLKYAAGLEIDPRGVVSHSYDVLGVEGILATPAIVESTSLVVAYGVDVFGSRITPSGMFDILGKSFNKVVLLGTVLALFAGVTTLAPMVRRKQIDRIWEAPS